MQYVAKKARVGQNRIGFEDLRSFVSLFLSTVQWIALHETPLPEREDPYHKVVL